MIAITLEKVFHRGFNRIRLNAPYNEKLIAFVKTLSSRKFSATMKCWYIDYTASALIQMHTLNNGKYNIVSGDLQLKSLCLEISEDKSSFDYKIVGGQNEEIIESIEKRFGAHAILNDWYRIQYSEHTYIQFLEFIDNELFVVKSHEAKRKATSVRIISKAEIEELLTFEKNEKYRLMLSLIYSCGLRRNEVSLIQMKHVDFENRRLKISGAKGKVDRVIPLGNRIYNMLKEYYVGLQNINFLFEDKAGVPYSAQLISTIFKKALQRAELSIKYSVHSLRQSYAVHLQEEGNDLAQIQELLGHNSAKTTSAYTHNSTKQFNEVHDPFEGLNI